MFVLVQERRGYGAVHCLALCICSVIKLTLLHDGDLKKPRCVVENRLANANGVSRSDRRTQRLFLFRINLFIISVWMLSSAKRQVRAAVVISQSCRSEKRFHPPAKRPKLKQREETNQVAANKNLACLLI